MERYNGLVVFGPVEATTMSRKKQQAPPGATKNGPPARPMSREDFLEFALSVVKAKEKLSLAAEQNLRANFGLQYDYPNEYVAFLDDWEGKGRNRRLIRRLVGHSPDMKTVSDLILKLPPEDHKRINFV